MKSKYLYNSYTIRYLRDYESGYYSKKVIKPLVKVKPKIDESVLVFNLDDNQNSQRFYIGPIISQPQKLEYDSYVPSFK